MEQKNEETLGTGASPVTTALSGMLTSEGAPWRPFEDKGLLLERSRTAQLAKALYAAGEQTLLTHLEAVCLWPERARNQSWRVGDYSCYVLSFEPAPGFQVYVQFRSEPDDGSVIFEVSSGALDPRAARYVDESKRERLRDHGFEIEGQARNFRKLVSVRDSRDLRGLAREAIAILTHVLGWNGTQALEYELSLQSGSQVRHVVEALSPETLAKMMREWGFPAQLKRSEGTGTLYIESRGPAQGDFGIAFGDESAEGSGEFQALRIRTYRAAEDDEAAEQQALLINQRLLGVRASADEDGDLVIETVVLLHGGVTAEHIRMRLEIWKWAVGEVGRGRLDQ